MRPVHGVQQRRRQLGEARVAADEAFQVARALLDGAEDFRQAFVAPAPHQFGAGMRQRGDRRQRVVELVADHADDLLPGLHFLAAQFGGQLAQQQQFVLAPVEAEVAARQVVDLFLFVLSSLPMVNRPSPPRCDGFAHPPGAAASRSSKRWPSSFRPPCSSWRAARLAYTTRRSPSPPARPAASPPACSAPWCRAAVRAAPALRVARAGRRRVRCASDQVAQLVAALPVEAEAEVAVAVAGDGARQRAEQRSIGNSARRVTHTASGTITNAESSADQLAVVQPLQQQQRQGDGRCQQRQQPEEQPSSDGPADHRAPLMGRAMPKPVHAPVQRLPAQAEVGGRLRDHAAGARQRGLDACAIRFVRCSLRWRRRWPGRPRSAASMRVPVASSAGALDHVAQFAHVARPGDAPAARSARCRRGVCPPGRKCSASGRMSSGRSASGGSAQLDHVEPVDTGLRGNCPARIIAAGRRWWR